MPEARSCTPPSASGSRAPEAWTSRAELDVEFLGEMLGEFFAEQGWGRLEATPLGSAVLALDSAEWAEALDERGASFRRVT